MRLRTLRRLPVTALVLTVAMILAVSAQAKTHHSKAHRVTSHRSSHASRAHRSTGKSRSRHHASSRHHVALGQRSIDSERVIEIQQALVKAHYLDGSPTGQWDPETQAAMVKFQSDNGWQSKIAPDSRALIKLGLGPKQDEGEYSSAASSSPRLENGTPVDTIRTMALTAMPAISMN